MTQKTKQIDKTKKAEYNTSEDYINDNSMDKSGSLTKKDTFHTVLIIVLGSLFGWVTFYPLGLLLVDIFPSLEYNNTYILLGMMYSIVPFVAGLTTRMFSRSKIPEIVSNGSLAGWMSFAPLTLSALEFMSENPYELVQNPMEHFPHLFAIVISGILFGYLGGKIGVYLSERFEDS